MIILRRVTRCTKYNVLERYFSYNHIATFYLVSAILCVYVHFRVVGNKHRGLPRYYLSISTEFKIRFTSQKFLLSSIKHFLFGESDKMQLKYGNEHYFKKIRIANTSNNIIYLHITCESIDKRSCNPMSKFALSSF